MQQLANAGAEALGEEPETVTENSPGDDGEIAALVTRWYGQAASSVCDSMTNKMLNFGWGKKGTEGRSLCEQALADAQPVVNPVVRKPAVQGEKATVEVVYGPEDERNIDEITLVRRNGAWLLDGVRLAGFDE